MGMKSVSQGDAAAGRGVFFGWIERKRKRFTSPLGL